MLLFPLSLYPGHRSVWCGSLPPPCHTLTSGQSRTFLLNQVLERMVSGKALLGSFSFAILSLPEFFFLTSGNTLCAYPKEECCAGWFHLFYFSLLLFMMTNAWKFLLSLCIGIYGKYNSDIYSIDICVNWWEKQGKLKCCSPNQGVRSEDHWLMVTLGNYHR